jgi:DNA-binding transcriptional LysR family regulator
MDQRPLPDLAVFALVAQHRSFRAAAQVLGVSASALSHTMRNLETRLDVRLLHRTTRSVAPTEAGERLLARLAPALADIDAALSEVAAFRDRPSGRLRVNIARSAARWLVGPRIGGFLNAHPDVRVEITCDDGLSDIVAGGFDCGVRLGESLQADMIAAPLGRELSQALVCAPSYVEAHGAPTRPEDVLTTAACCFAGPAASPGPGSSSARDARWSSIRRACWSATRTR